MPRQECSFHYGKWLVHWGSILCFHAMISACLGSQFEVHFLCPIHYYQILVSISSNLQGRPVASISVPPLND
ncbi:hypothetical protein HBH63_072860 [Parastagonospora nodorum]|nr:hypothetical protein HBH62_032890 [Parastagonospora nodorum]KAH4798009.1 hypothetical protein HBH63_072860 [Parastagonospora nodorum]